MFTIFRNGSIRKSLFMFSIVGAVLLVGCAKVGGDNPADKRKSIDTMEQKTLVAFIKKHPQLKQKIAAAPGYGVFSNVNINVIFSEFWWWVWCCYQQC